MVGSWRTLFAARTVLAVEWSVSIGWVGLWSQRVLGSDRIFYSTFFIISYDMLLVVSQSSSTQNVLIASAHA